MLSSNAITIQYAKIIALNIVKIPPTDVGNFLC